MAQTLSAVSLVFFPALAVFAVAAPEFVPVVLGKQWMGAVAPIQVLAVAGMLRVLANPAGMLTKGFGAVYEALWRSVVYAVVLAASAYVGSYWGIVGVAWGVLFSTVLAWALSAHLVYRCSGFTAGSYLVSIRGGALCALAGATAAAAARSFAVGRGLPTGATLCITLAGGLVGGLPLALFGPFPEVRRTLGHLQRFLAQRGRNVLPQ